MCMCVNVSMQAQTGWRLWMQTNIKQSNDNTNLKKNVMYLLLLLFVAMRWDEVR